MSRLVLLVCVLAGLLLAAFGRTGQAGSAQEPSTPAPPPSTPDSGLRAPSPGAAPAGEPMRTVSPRNANYEIDVRLDHAARTLVGRETVRWRNITTRSTSELQFHLYWNAWRDADSTWMRERKLSPTYRAPRADAWGRMDVTAVRLLTGTSGETDPPGSPDAVPPSTLAPGAAAGAIDLTSSLRFIAPDDGNARDRTTATLPLPFTVDPGMEVRLEIAWTATIPRPFARTGYVGDYYFIAQWFPKVGVLEEAGWNTHQFHAATEFFADYGIYDVDITVPAAFVVGGSGRRTGTRANADGTVTHRYHGEDIHDVAWTASPDFIDLSRTFEHGTLPRVDMRLLLLPEHRHLADRYFSIVAHTLRLYGTWFGAYPYGYMTIVDPAYQSQSDGMEYPTLFTGRARWLSPSDVQTPESTTAHEAGHQWWYGLVGSNEFEDAWLDEGINTYATARVIDEVFQPNHVEQRFFAGFVPWVPGPVPLSRLDGDRLTGYRENAEADVPSTPTWRFWPATSTFITYNKTALWLHTLERHLGWPTMQRALAVYFARWKFRHPKPDDFFAVLNEVSGQDLSWFVEQVHRSSNTFDYRLQDIRSERLPDGRHRTTVVARRDGEGVFPVDVVTTFADGEAVTERWNGRERRALYVYERPSAATVAHVDPERILLLDVDYANNSLALDSRGAEASRKWALTWMTWLQEALITYGFFL